MGPLGKKNGATGASDLLDLAAGLGGGMSKSGSLEKKLQPVSEPDLLTLLGAGSAERGMSKSGSVEKEFGARGQG